MKIRLLTLACLWVLLVTSDAGAVDIEQLPEPFANGEEGAWRSCAQLDRAIARLLPLSYGHVPSLYSSPSQGAAIWAGVLVHPVALGYVGYTTYSARLEKMQRSGVKRRIDALRRMKAEKRCFEDI